jgi:hypothetical protein
MIKHCWVDWTMLLLMMLLLMMLLLMRLLLTMLLPTMLLLTRLLPPCSQRPVSAMCWLVVVPSSLTGTKELEEHPLGTIRLDRCTDNYNRRF